MENDDHLVRAVTLWEAVGMVESVKVKVAVVDLTVLVLVHVHVRPSHATFSAFSLIPLPRQQALVSLQTHYKTLNVLVYPTTDQALDLVATAGGYGSRVPLLRVECRLDQFPSWYDPSRNRHPVMVWR